MANGLQALGRRLDRLEEMAGVDDDPSRRMRVIIRCVVGATDLPQSTCRRNQSIELIHLHGSGTDLAEGELDAWVASFPIERGNND